MTFSETNGAALSVAAKLLAYCESQEWSGIDPYDALNSRIFEGLPFLDRRLPRLVLTQVLKRSPVNIRPLLLVPSTMNAKAIGLFLMSYVRLSRLGLLGREDLVGTMAEHLKRLRASNSPYWCWGYSFPWQTRTLVVPRGTPNLVCTTFVANALLDAYEYCGDASYLDMATSGAEYLLNELYWTEGETVAGFGYPLPSMRHNIHNGNFLGAALFARIARHTGQTRFVEPAWRIARYSASRQQEDGAWYYGEQATQRWVDNFHTGYNLCALRTFGTEFDTTEFESHIRRGFGFYLKHFFRADGAPRYFHNATYPIDTHCVAQAILTLCVFQDLSPESRRLAERVFAWSTRHMWDDRGFFYYRRLRLGSIKTSYMRWSQAWMLLAVTALLDETGAVSETSDPGAMVTGARA